MLNPHIKAGISILLCYATIICDLLSIPIPYFVYAQKKYAAKCPFCLTDFVHTDTIIREDLYGYRSILGIERNRYQFSLIDLDYDPK